MGGAPRRQAETARFLNQPHPMSVCFFNRPSGGLYVAGLAADNRRAEQDLAPVGARPVVLRCGSARVPWRGRLYSPQPAFTPRAAGLAGERSGGCTTQFPWSSPSSLSILPPRIASFSGSVSLAMLRTHDTGSSIAMS